MDASVIGPPTNSLVGPLLTDMYQITMTYGYWRDNKANDQAVFDLFFRKSPFGGEYCIFAGQDEVLKFVSTFRCDQNVHRVYADKVLLNETVADSLKAISSS